MAGGRANSNQRDTIEHLVRQVLAELQAANKPRPAAGGELVLSARVVTLADVEGRLEGVTRVVVERGAVFTPSARDALRRQGVAIASAVQARKATKRRLAMGVSETRFEPAALVAALAGEGIEVERLPNVGLATVVDEMCDAVVESGMPGVLFTERAAGALCLANRQRGVRAALAISAVAVGDALRDVAANLLVVDPRGKSTFELRQIVRQLVRHTGACRADLAARLD